MPISLDRINTELNSLTRRLDFDRLPAAQLTAQFDQLSSQMSQLGTQVGQVAGGFQSLTQELDIPPELLDDALTNLEAASSLFSGGAAFDLQEELQNVRGVVDRGIAMLVENPPNIQIGNAVSALNSELEAITEGAVAGGFNNLIITANTPEAMAQKMTEVAGVALTEAQDALRDILPQVGALQQSITPVLENLQNNLPAIQSLSSQVESFLGTANEFLNLAASPRGLLNDLVENLSGSINNDVLSLLNINANIPSSILDEGVRLLQSGGIEQAATLLQGFTDLNLDDLKDGLEQINVTLSRDVENSTAANTSPTPVISPTQRPTNTNQPITDASVLYGIISSVDRDLTELVFRAVSFSHPERGVDPASYSNYHLIVQADGTINRIAALSNPLDVSGHEQYSLGIIVAARNGRVTPDQTAAIDKIMAAFFSIIPYGQIVNYFEINGESRPQIIFDFVDFATEHFSYQTVMNGTSASLSSDQIQQRISSAARSVSPHIDDTV